MKKLILLIFLIPIGFFACKKEKKNQPVTSQGKLYAVNFNLSGFTQQILKTNSLHTYSTPPDGIVSIYYAVYDQATGEFKHYLKQTSSQSNFGKVTDSLAAGNYTLLFIGGAGGLLFTYNTLLPNTYIGYNVYHNPFNNPWHDTFVGKHDITVSDGNIDEDVDLDRIVGQLEINIEDAIPAGASYIEADITSESDQYMLGTDLPNTPSKTLEIDHNFTSSEPGTINFKLSTIMCNTSTPFSVHIICKSKTNTILGETTVTNIICQKNKKTVLSGELFGSTGATSFTVGIDNDWDPNITTIHF